MTLSLIRRKSTLAQAANQRQLLEEERPFDWPTFAQKLAHHDVVELRAVGIDVLQVNVGKVCNQTCSHCHVDAGPDRHESMSHDTAEAVIQVLANTDIRTLDITGGAPEMNPQFGYLVENASRLNRRIIDRSNLTILVANGFRHLPSFLAAHRVEVVASLPCYLEQNCDSQRGSGVFKRSLEALRELNALGYGKPGSGLILNLVYNPIGPGLPPDQQSLQEAYRRELFTRYGIEFTNLHVITNMPISRYLEDLLRTGQFETYMQTLIASFNSRTVENLMCRGMISVDWEGRLFDCDFNQMLDLKLDSHLPQTIHEFDVGRLRDRIIRTGRHCFGCTAGCGSSCQGSLVSIA